MSGQFRFLTVVVVFNMLISWLCLLLLPAGFTYVVDQTDESGVASQQFWASRGSVEEAVVFGRHGCEGPGGRRGRCVPMEDCVLEGVNQDYGNKDYTCVLRDQRGIGVCCPDTTPDPLKNQENEVTDVHLRPTRESGPQEPPILDDIQPIADFRICGRNGKQVSITSAGGGKAKVKDWPWMAAIVNSTTTKQFCGGTVITKRHVLTAAHCFYDPYNTAKNDPNSILVILGDHDLIRKDDSKSKIFSVVEIIIHEDYDIVNHENDIAIVKLKSATVYNSFVQPCCLPSPGSKFINVTAVATGWGKLKFKGKNSPELMEVAVPIWENKMCADNIPSGTIFEENICAGAYEGGKDPCQGDSGGPLVTQGRGDRWILVGVVSWGIGCGDKGKPGIYTRVSDYLDWIEEHIS